VRAKKECNKTECAIQKRPETTTTQTTTADIMHRHTHTFAWQTVDKRGNFWDRGSNWMPYHM